VGEVREDRLDRGVFLNQANRGSGMEPMTLKDRQRAILVANRIRDFWKRLGFQVKVEVQNDGSFRSDMIAGKPTRRLT
jgi:hypothetical protein